MLNGFPFFIRKQFVGFSSILHVHLSGVILVHNIHKKEQRW